MVGQSAERPVHFIERTEIGVAPGFHALVWKTLRKEMLQQVTADGLLGVRDPAQQFLKARSQPLRELRHAALTSSSQP